jgi:hypothetical protein
MYCFVPLGDVLNCSVGVEGCTEWLNGWWVILNCSVVGEECAKLFSAGGMC